MKMIQANQEMNNLIENSVRRFAEKGSKLLGNRALYIGASDLASAAGCLRSVAMNKYCIAGQQPFQRLLTFQRGHALERSLFDALAPFALGIEQMEIEFDWNSIKHKFHLDLVLIDQQGEGVTVLENKTTRSEKPELRDSYVTQLQVQMGALERFWDQRCFSAAQAVEKTTFPELVEYLYGIKLKKNINGFIPVTSTQDELGVYGPYSPPGDSFWDEMMGLSARLVAAKNNPAAAPYAKGFHILCDYCDGQQSCPKFAAVEIDGLDPVLQGVKKLREAEAAIQAALAEKEKTLKEFYLRVQNTVGRRYLACPTGKYRLSSSSREYYKKDNIRRMLYENNVPITEIDAILASAATVSDTQSLRFVWT